MIVVESNTCSQLSKAIKDYTRRWQNTFCQTHFNVLGKWSGQANDIEMQYCCEKDNEHSELVGHHLLNFFYLGAT
jgi:hypothetical protein